METALRLRNPAPLTFEGLLRDHPLALGALCEREVSLCQGGSGQPAAVLTVFPMTKAGSWKTELDLLVAFLLLFKQPRHLGRGSLSEESLQGPSVAPAHYPAGSLPWLPSCIGGAAPLGSEHRLLLQSMASPLPLALWPPVPSPPTSDTHFPNKSCSHASCRWSFVDPLQGMCFLPLSVCFYLTCLLLLCSVYLATLFLTS